MATSSKEGENWKPSHGNYLAGISRQVRTIRRKQVIRRRMLVSLAVVGVGLLVISVADNASRPGRKTIPMIACEAVQANLPAYIAGTLDDRTSTEIEAHLKVCTRCREAVAKMRPNTAEDMLGRPTPKVASAFTFRSNEMLLAEK